MAIIEYMFNFSMAIFDIKTPARQHKESIKDLNPLTKLMKDGQGSPSQVKGAALRRRSLSGFVGSNPTPCTERASHQRI